MHSLQKRWPQRLMMTPLNRTMQVEHLSIFWMRCRPRVRRREDKR